MTNTTLSLKCDFSSDDYFAINRHLGRLPIMWDTIKDYNPCEAKKRLAAFYAIANYPSDFFYAKDVGIDKYITCAGFRSSSAMGNGYDDGCLYYTGHKRTEMISVGDGYWKEVKANEWQRIIPRESLLQELAIVEAYYREACASF